MREIERVSVCVEIGLRILQLMEVFVKECDHPGRGSLHPSVLCLPHDYCRRNVAANRRKRREKTGRHRASAKEDVALQFFVVTDAREVG